MELPGRQDRALGVAGLVYVYVGCMWRSGSPYGGSWAARLYVRVRP